MDTVPPYLLRLINKASVPQSQIPARDAILLRPLFDSGIIGSERAGRGESVRVIHEQAFLSWARHNFPTFEDKWNAPDGAGRAQAVALRRDSKTGGAGVQYGVLHLRALNPGERRLWLNAAEFPVAAMTAKHGLAACLINENSSMAIEGRVALIENLECFLRAEVFLSDVSWVLNSAGRVSERLIACLKKSTLASPPLLHLPDYDPVGLSDYLRLRAELDSRVELWVPPDLEHRFTTFGNRELILRKPRNRSLLEQLSAVSWPCVTSARVFHLIKETGSGLEQESLLIRKGPASD